MNLTGKLLLGVTKQVEGWFSVGNKVTKLNIFSSNVPVEEMVLMTQKNFNHCNAKGSYLDWDDMQWTLQGQAELTAIPVMEPCKEEPLLRIYTKFRKMTDCMHHCQKLGGRVVKIVNATEWQNFQFFMKEKLYGPLPVLVGNKRLYSR